MATQTQVMPGRTTALSTSSQSIKRQKVLQIVLLYLLSIGLSVLFIFPFFWTVSTSLKALDELFTFPPTWLPAVPQWQNYPAVLNRVPFLLWTWNSIYIVALNTLGNFASVSSVERFLFGPLTIVMTAACLFVAAAQTN